MMVKAWKDAVTQKTKQGSSPRVAGRCLQLRGQTANKEMTYPTSSSGSLIARALESVLLMYSLERREGLGL